VLAGLYALITVLLAGCNTPQNRLAEFNRLYEKGDMSGAASYLTEKIKPGDSASGANLLWTMQLGLVERTRKQYAASNQWFDKAEALSKAFDTDITALDVIGTTMVNDNTRPYRGHAYDMIMVNTYKALNFMALGRDDLARVEFNRALERQIRAREAFNKEIQQRKEQMDKSARSKNVNLDKTLNDPNTEARIRKYYPNLYDFQAYPDFVNPAATYLAGVSFMMTDDPGKAADLIKESAGMVPDNTVIARDFASLQDWLDRGRAPAPCAWGVFENGLGPVKEEFRVDLPLWMVSNRMIYTGIALPRLVNRAPAADAIEVNSADGWVRTEPVADMDRVIQTEFAKNFPGILTRAIIAAAGKAVVQNTLLDKQEPGTQVLGLMMAAYTAATTVADVRMWTGLPKEFQAARVPMPAGGALTLRVAGRSLEIPIESCRYAMVYVKMVSHQSEPLWNVITR